MKDCSTVGWWVVAWLQKPIAAAPIRWPFDRLRTGYSLRTALPILVSLLIMLPVGAASMELRQFDDAAKQERYQALIKELRCLVCQNQALSDSDADLAKDLRDEVYRIIQSGKSDLEAVNFLVSRYGDFVLYRPPFKPLTLLLWGGPLLLSLIGAAVLWRQWHRHRSVDTQTLSDADATRLQQLRTRADPVDELP